MTSTRTRPETTDANERVSANDRFSKTWLLAILAAAAVATGILVSQLAAVPAVDDSFDAAELAFMFAQQTQATAPATDESFQSNEMRRQQGLVTNSDESVQRAEDRRFASLAPTTDDSFDRAESVRQSALGG